MHRLLIIKKKLIQQTKIIIIILIKINKLLETIKTIKLTKQLNLVFKSDLKYPFLLTTYLNYISNFNNNLIFII